MNRGSWWEGRARPDPRRGSWFVDRAAWTARRALGTPQLRLKRSNHAGFAAIRAARAAPRGERGLDACFSQIITSKFVSLQKRGFIKLVSAY